MRQLLSISLLGVVGLLAISSQPSTALVPINEAVIVNSGSTNMIGYRIYVSSSGEAHYVDGKGQGQRKLPSDLARRLFWDIKAAMPLSNLPADQHCMKSSSFGTSITVRVGAEQSPDLSCSDNRKVQMLDNDVEAIAQFLHVTNVPKSKGKPLPLQNF